MSQSCEISFGEAITSYWLLELTALWSFICT